MVGMPYMKRNDYAYRRYRRCRSCWEGRQTLAIIKWQLHEGVHELTMCCQRKSRLQACGCTTNPSQQLVGIRRIRSCVWLDTGIFGWHWYLAWEKKLLWLLLHILRVLLGHLPISLHSFKEFLHYSTSSPQSEILCHEKSLSISLTSCERLQSFSGLLKILISIFGNVLHNSCVVVVVVTTWLQVCFTFKRLCTCICFVNS